MDVIQKDDLLEEMLRRIENDDLQIEALILEGSDWQQQNDGELIECHVQYTHGREFKHPKYSNDSYDYMDVVLDNKGVLQAFYKLNASEIEESMLEEKDAIVRVTLDGMSIWLYENGIMKLTARLEPGLQEIKYYNVEMESIKHLQSVLLEDFYQYWVKGKGAKEREEDPSINEFWQIRQVLENELESLRKKL